MTNPASSVGHPPALGPKLRFLMGMLLVAYWPTLVTFPSTWSESQEHGFFIGGLVAWLAWRERRRIQAHATPGLGDLVPVAAMLSLGWLLAATMNVRAGHQLAFALVCMVWAFAVFGWGARVQILTLGGTLSLATSLWGLLVPVLQRMTVIVSGAATRLAGIEAQIDYDTITISTGTFVVTQGCAGINYLMGGLTLGAFYANVFVSRWQTKLKIVALAGVASIVGNWIRVTALIFLGEATAMQSPYLADHLWQGWAIFVLIMIPAYQIARRIEKRDALAARAALDAQVEAEGPVGGDYTDGPGEPAGARRAADVLSPRLATLATAAALTGPVLYMVIGAMPRGTGLDRTAEIFTIHSSWAAPAAAPPRAWRPAYHGIDDRADWTVEVQGREVELSRYYFVDQRQGTELIQNDNRIAADSLVVIDRTFGPVGPRLRIVNEAIFFADGQPRIVWYWYRVGGFDTPFSSKAKLLEAIAYFRRSAAAELVTMSAVCEPGSCADAARVLRAAVDGPEAIPRGGP